MVALGVGEVVGAVGVDGLEVALGAEEFVDRADGGDYFADAVDVEVVVV